MLSSSFMVSSIFYCTIYSLTLKQIPFLLLSNSRQSEMIIWSYRIAFQHLFGLPKHLSPQEESKVDLFHKRHNHTTQWWILRSRSGRRTFISKWNLNRKITAKPMTVEFSDRTLHRKNQTWKHSRIKILIQWSITHYSLSHLPSLLLRS